MLTGAGTVLPVMVTVFDVTGVLEGGSVRLRKVKGFGVVPPAMTVVVDVDVTVVLEVEVVEVEVVPPEPPAVVTVNTPITPPTFKVALVVVPAVGAVVTLTVIDCPLATVPSPDTNGPPLIEYVPPTIVTGAGAELPVIVTVFEATGVEVGNPETALKLNWLGVELLVDVLPIGVPLAAMVRMTNKAGRLSPGF